MKQPRKTQPTGDLKALLQDNMPTLDSEPKSTKVRKSHQAPVREGKKMISGYFDKKVHQQLKLIALETDKPIQHLLGDALNALFVMHDKPPIA